MKIFVLLPLLATAACGAAVSPPQDAPQGADAAVEATHFSPGVISDHRWQYRITFTPDGDTAYFAVADGFFPAVRRSSIHVSHRTADGAWSAPAVAAFSGTHTDIDPFVTPDGRRLYFSSIRPVDGVLKPALDIFYMERTSAGWSDPIRLGPEINSERDELYPSLDASGTLYFASGPFRPTPGEGWDIYSAPPRGDGFAPRAPVAAVNTRLPWNPEDPTQDWEFNPEVSADGRILVFASLRPGGHGSGDLYVSHRQGGEWSAPVNLGPAVNSSHDEFHPTLSRDGRTLYFARTLVSPAVVPSNFYRVPTHALDGFPR
jgi:Tol biopolymer transport system component